MTDKSHECVWELCFATEVRTKAEHRLGWDAVAQAFIVECDGVQDALRMPVELAEAFLLKCLEKDFNERFLQDWLRAEQDQLMVGDASLFVYRGKVEPCISRRPKLLLWIQEEGHSKNVSLVHELRIALSRAMKSLSAEEIHSHLYPPQAAAA